MTENNINKIKIILIDNNGNTITSTIDYKGYVDGKNIHGFNLIEDVIKVMIKDYEETKQKLRYTQSCFTHIQTNLKRFEWTIKYL